MSSISVISPQELAQIVQEAIAQEIEKIKQQESYPPILSIEHVASLLGYSIRSINRLYQEGFFPAECGVKIFGGQNRLYWHRDQFLEWWRTDKAKHHHKKK